jgi:hypothetical protein
VLAAVFIPLDRVVSKEEPFTEQWVWINCIGKRRAVPWCGYLGKASDRTHMKQYLPVLAPLLAGILVFAIGLASVLWNRWHSPSKQQSLFEPPQKHRRKFDFS